MALFSYGTDTLRSQPKKTGSGILGLLRGKQPTATAPGTFNGPVQFRAPGTPMNVNDLTVTQNPYGPKPQPPAVDPNHLYAGTPPAAKAPVQGPAAPKPVVTAPKAPVAPKAPAPTNPQPPAAPAGGGFTSTDPAIQARIKAMQAQAGGEFQTNTAIEKGPTSMPLGAPTTMPTVSDAAASGATQPKPNINLSLLRGDKTTQQSQIDALRKGYLSTFAPSDAEKALQDELASYRESANLGVAGLEGQGRGIPLDLVRGQQAILQKQAGIKEQSLLERLQMEQQNRTLAQQAAQAELGFAETDAAKEEARQAATAAGLKPIEVGGNLVALNPSTGKYEVVYQAPASGSESGFTLSEGQQRYDANGNLIAGAAKQTDPLAQRKAELEIAQLEQKLNGGESLTPMEQLQYEKLYKEVHPGENSQAADVLQNKKQLLQDIMNSSGLASAVGILGSTPTVFNIGQKQQVLGQLDQLISTEALDKLISAKAQGATFGALSEGELNLLKNSATTLGSWATRDKNGKLTGFKIGEKEFNAELKHLLELTNKAISNAGSGGSTSGSAPPTEQEIQQMRDAGFTDQEILEWQNSFTNDPSKSVNGSIKVAVAANAFPTGVKGGQCGAFVNKLTGIGMGDSYKSKLAKCDPSIGKPGNPPQPGDVFVMPYSWTGHTGVVTAVKPLPDGSYELSVTDSNYKLNEKVVHHKLNSNSIEAYARVPLKQ